MTSGGVVSNTTGNTASVSTSGAPSGAKVIPFPNANGWLEEWFGDEGLLARARPGYEKREGQIALSKAVADALSEKRHALAEGPCGCHVAGQPILMFDGTIKRVEDIVVGDRLMGMDGSPRTVLSLARGEQETVDIVPIKGETWRVNIDHILTLVRYDNGRITDVRVRDYVGWSRTQKSLWKLFRVGVNFSQSEPLPLDAYLLGVILGDGCITGATGGACVTKGDMEIVSALREYAAAQGLRVRTKGIAHHVVGDVGNKHHPLIAALRALGLWGTDSATKFIPHRYKTASRADRLAMLAGLMDTDGSITGVSCFDYISKSKTLAEDVAFIARSVGLAAYVSPCEKFCQTGAGGTYYRVSISGDCSMIPTRIARKKAPARRQQKSALRTGFSVVPSGKIEPFYGFSLDGDGRFLLGDFTVTHNTGKSLAYLIAAIRFVQANPGKRVVIATETIALQEQLVGKDLPFLASIAPGGFRFALRHGRAQYLCNDAFSTWDAKAGRFTLNDDEQMLRAWGRETKTGSRTSLPLAVPDRTWSKVTVDSDECKGKDCPAREVCFYEQARDAIKDAQIIVANYKLLCIQLAMTADGADPKALPLGEFHALIADEAHGLVDVARDTFGATITEGSFAKTLNFVREYLPDGTAERFEDAVGGVFNRLRGWTDEHAPRPAENRYAPRAEDAVRVPLDTEPSFSVELAPLVTELERIGERASAMEAKLTARERDVGRLDSDEREARSRARSTARRVGKQLVSLALFNRASLDPSEPAARALAERAERYALWVELDRGATGERAVRLEARKVDVRDTLASLLWSKMPCVLTSATLTVEGGFEHIEQESGIGDHNGRAPIRLEVPSPFDFATRCLLVTPTGIPQPNDPNWRRACATVIRGVLNAADGRTLALFSSNAAMDAAYRAITDGKRNERLWLKQGEASTGALSQTFKDNARSVLFGTKSFWTGIDVPGDSLVAVVIDRVPFTPPTDPVVRRLHALLEKRGLSGFTHCDLPRAIMQVRQAFGRLIRTRSDYGVVVLLDSRVSTARWGRSLLRSLPACVRGTQLADVRDHLARFQDADGADGASNTATTGTEGGR